MLDECWTFHYFLVFCTHACYIAGDLSFSTYVALGSFYDPLNYWKKSLYVITCVVNSGHSLMRVVTVVNVVISTAVTNAALIGCACALPVCACHRHWYTKQEPVAFQLSKGLVGHSQRSGWMFSNEPLFSWYEETVSNIFIKTEPIYEPLNILKVCKNVQIQSLVNAGIAGDRSCSQKFIWKSLNTRWLL